MDKTEKSTMSTPATVVGPNTRIKGNIEGDEDLTVVGRVEGNITLTRSLTVDPSGVVVADIHVHQAMISGVVVGNVTADELVHITEEGRVVGDLHAPRIVLVDGAAFKGNIDMGEMEAPEPLTSAETLPRPKPRPAPGPRATSEVRPKVLPPPTPPVPERRPAPRRPATPPTENKAEAATRAVAEAVAQAHPAIEGKRGPSVPKPPTTAGKKTRARRK